jgi:hypothetical protein
VKGQFVIIAEATKDSFQITDVEILCGIFCAASDEPFDMKVFHSRTSPLHQDCDSPFVLGTNASEQKLNEVTFHLTIVGARCVQVLLALLQVKIKLCKLHSPSAEESLFRSINSLRHNIIVSRSTYYPLHVGVVTYKLCEA